LSSIDSCCKYFGWSADDEDGWAGLTAVANMLAGLLVREIVGQELIAVANVLAGVLVQRWSYDSAAVVNYVQKRQASRYIAPCKLG
jgi:hypothetical protein